MKTKFNNDSISKNNKSDIMNTSNIESTDRKMRSSRRMIEIVKVDNVVNENIEELLGKEVYNNMNEIIPVNQAFSNVKLIGLFFCSVWASPCKLIANELIELYNETNQGIKNLEIIQITLEKDLLPGDCNKDENERIRKEGENIFKSKIQDFPWLFYQYNNETCRNLKEKFNIKNVPQLIILDEYCNILTKEGVKEYFKYGVDIGEKWMELNKNK